MSFEVDPEVGAVLAVLAASSGPMPPPPPVLGEGHESADVDPTAAPARLVDATGLPPAYIEVGQLDIFRDEDVAYAITLSRAGVPVELHLHPGVPHEYDAIAFDTDVARRAQVDRHRVLRSI